MLSEDELNRYSRQIGLVGFGIAGQEKLKQSRVLVVGAGGLGCPALQYLAASGVGTIGVIDDDQVSASNLHRQILYGVDDIGRSKVDCACSALLKLNPDIEVKGYRARLSVVNAVAMFNDYDLILDGSDNFPTRYLINDAAVTTNRAFIAASVLRFTAQIGVYNARIGDILGPTYRCLFPTPPDSSLVPTCNEGGVLGVLPGIAGVIQATEAIKYLLGIGQSLIGKVLLIDLLTNSFSSISICRNEEIVAKTRILREGDYQKFGRVCISAVQEITVQELKQKLDSGEELFLLDVREQDEREAAHLGGEHIPLRILSDKLDQIPRNITIVVYCRSGGRSRKACDDLQSKYGIENVFNLKGGIMQWAEEIDSSLRPI